MKAVKFFNSTKEDFAHKWDNEMFTFKAGETVMLDEALAFHFAKHLAVRELNRSNTITDSQHLPPLRDSFIISTDVEDESEAKLKMKMLNQEEAVKPFCDSCDSKGGRHLKVCPTLKVEVSEEANFEGLKE